MRYALDESTEAKHKCNNGNSEQYFILHYYFVFHFNSLHLFIIRILKYAFFSYYSLNTSPAIKNNVQQLHQRRWRQWRWKQQQQQRHRHGCNAGSRQGVWIKKTVSGNNGTNRVSIATIKRLQSPGLDSKQHTELFLWISGFYDLLCISRLFSVATEREEAENMYMHITNGNQSLIQCRSAS